jgi:sialate O-acetylesterase
MRRTECWTIVLALCASWLASQTALADVRLPKIFGDHMVLQQGMQNAFWGTADAGEQVTVTIGDMKAVAMADADGRWLVRIAAPPVGGPYALSVTGKNSITLKDVLCGEVWICSGQSNMQWPVQRANDGPNEINAANHPKLRLFQVDRRIAEAPQSDCEGEWLVCSPQTIAGFSAVGYFFGRELQKNLDVPVGLVQVAWGGTIAEAWMSRESLAGVEEFKPIVDRAAKFSARQPNQASNLYDGMLAPVIPLSMRGVIWYQGESNVSRAEQYAKLFPALIADWRRAWGQGDFPFLFVQLAPYRYGPKDPAECAELREAQLKTLLAVKNTGMVVTTDIGNVKDIHPRNKQEVGRRLALWALGTTYAKEVVYSGPLYDSLTIEDNKIRIKFKHTAGGLVAKDNAALTQFTIAGEDQKFMPAVATIDGETLLVSSDAVAKPVAVRFGWRDDAEPNLLNQANLPASPFRTDAWKMVTEGKR